ncbi:MAG: hypothetical protein EHM40_02930 [Chloroflexi bacterium]|nr:MAG: hypothetical protein EHM40_02930 [Chloroflexota bacterium]
MYISAARARKLAKRLCDENAKGRSWRTIAREDYGNQISHATINRIANKGGEWLPKDKRLLVLLGLKKPRGVRPLPKWLQDTPEARAWFDGQRQKVGQMAKATRDEMRKKL